MASPMVIFEGLKKKAKDSYNDPNSPIGGVKEVAGAVKSAAKKAGEGMGNVASAAANDVKEMATFGKDLAKTYKEKLTGEDVKKGLK